MLTPLKLSDAYGNFYYIQPANNGIYDSIISYDKTTHKITRTPLETAINSTTTN